MNTDFLSNLVSANMTGLTVHTVNGECRFLKANDAESTNDRGFPNSGTVPRRVDFLPCSWSAKTLADAEKIIGEQTRASFVYEITVSKKINNSAVLCEPSDKLEIRFIPNGELETLEIISLKNQANVAWLVYAVGIDNNES